MSEISDKIEKITFINKLILALKITFKKLL